MKVEGPAHIETKATGSKGSVGRHLGLAAAHGKAKAEYEDTKRRLKQKLAADIASPPVSAFPVQQPAKQVVNASVPIGGPAPVAKQPQGRTWDWGSSSWKSAPRTTEQLGGWDDFNKHVDSTKQLSQAPQSTSYTPQNPHPDYKGFTPEQIAQRKQQGVFDPNGLTMSNNRTRLPNGLISYSTPKWDRLQSAHDQRVVNQSPDRRAAQSHAGQQQVLARTAQARKDYLAKHPEAAKPGELQTQQAPTQRQQTVPVAAGAPAVAPAGTVLPATGMQQPVSQPTVGNPTQQTQPTTLGGIRLGQGGAYELPTAYPTAGNDEAIQRLDRQRAVNDVTSVASLVDAPMQLTPWGRSQNMYKQLIANAPAFGAAFGANLLYPAQRSGSLQDAAQAEQRSRWLGAVPQFLSNTLSTAASPIGGAINYAVDPYNSSGENVTTGLATAAAGTLGNEALKHIPASTIKGLASRAGVAGLAAQGANTLINGLRLQNTEAGQQKIDDAFRASTVADKDRSTLGSIGAGLADVAAGALGADQGSLAAGAAALARAYGKTGLPGSEAVTEAQKGFLADEASQKHYLERKAQYKAYYEKAYPGAGVSDLFAEQAAKQDANNFWRSQMKGDKVFAGRNNLSRFDNTPQGQALGRLANQIGHANLKRLLEDPQYASYVDTLTAPQAGVDPTQYGINTDAYAYRR